MKGRAKLVETNQGDVYQSGAKPVKELRPPPKGPGLTAEQELADTVPDWVKDFLDHMRETCVEERQKLKLDNRRLRERVKNLEAALLAEQYDNEDG